MVEKIHSHRNLIGFDENGIPTVTLKASAHSSEDIDADYQAVENGDFSQSGHSHHHHHEETEEDEDAFIKDYMNAVSAYRKTFPNKQEQIEKTADPAIREMLLRSEQLGIDTTFDRFDKQQPQCNFGMAGICCKICNMGPCRITQKAKKGVCGADADLIVARNLLRAAAAGAAQHGMHARELMLELMWAAEGKLDEPLLGKQKILSTAKAFGIKTEHRQLKNVAYDLAKALLDDLSSPDPEHEYKTLEVCAPAERVKTWKDLDLIPISAYHEVFEAYHKTGVGTDGDWKSTM